MSQELSAHAAAQIGRALEAVEDLPYHPSLGSVRFWLAACQRQVNDIERHREPIDPVAVDTVCASAAIGADVQRDRVVFSDRDFGDESAAP